MKIFSVIMSTYIALLVFQPGLKQVYAALTQPAKMCCSDHCCSPKPTDRKQLPEHENEDSCCPNGICNPFLHCACCVGVTVTESSILLDTKVSVASLVIPYSEKFESTYIPYCFHPPDVA